MITHRLRSLHILIHDEYRSTEKLSKKLSTGLRNVRLLVRPPTAGLHSTSVVAVGLCSDQIFCTALFSAIIRNV